MNVCSAFDGGRLIASGGPREVASRVKVYVDEDPNAQPLIFDDQTSQIVELDFRGTLEDVLARLPPEERKGPGRPKLGVIPREVTLLPRHWEWLERQPGGASVALRKLVEEARRTHASKDEIREAQDVCYRFMSAMAGNYPRFEEATRYFFRGDKSAFLREIVEWPVDVKQHVLKLAEPAFVLGRLSELSGKAP